MPSPDLFTERDIFRMDLFTYPVGITLSDRKELGFDAPDSSFYGKPGPFLLTTHPECTKLGPAYCVTKLESGTRPRGD